MKNISIAIDGPSGAGKSTLARQAAKALGFIYVDTGALYRTLALHVLRKGVDPGDGKAVETLLPELIIETKYDSLGLQLMFLNGRDVSAEIRTPEVSIAASRVSAHPCVRQFLLETQREMARKNSVVMDGRDIGTVVLPEADVKIFLTASLHARAQRRLRELRERGVETTIENVERDMYQRDENDAHRDTAPLKAADDAVLLDTTDLTLEESLERVVSLCRERIRAL